MIKHKKIKQLLNYLLLFIILNTINSCQKEQDVNALYNTWEFEYFTKKEFNLKNDKDYPPDELNKMTVGFFEDNKFSKQGQNNICYGSTFKADENGNLEISGGICTLVGGTKEQLEWEKRYFNALRNSKEFKIKDKNLKIYYNNDDETDVMVFKKQ